MRKLLIVLLGVIFLITPFCYAAWKFNPHTNKMDYYDANPATGGGWTDGGTVIYPTTITDNVGIGTTAPLGLLQVGTSPGALLVTNTNVGIGVTSPIGLLQVGTNPAKPGLLVLPNNNVGIGWTSPVGLLQVSTTSSSGLVVLSNGNVGIGTTNPARRLQVVGDYARIGDGGTINYADGDGDLYVEDGLEVDGIARVGSLIAEGGDASLIRTDDEMAIALGASADNSWEWRTTGNDYLSWDIRAGSANGSGNIILCEAGDSTSKNWEQPLVIDPHFRIQSSDANTISDFIQSWHDGTDGNIEVGDGKLNLLTTTVNINSLHAFNAVVYENNGVYTDHTAEAKTIGGTPFTIAETSAEDILYLGKSIPFSQAYFDLNTISDGDITALDVEEYTTAAAWYDVSGDSDGTSLFTQDGRYTWTSTREMYPYSINTVTGDTTGLSDQTAYFWVRFKWTGNASPAVTADTITYKQFLNPTISTATGTLNITSGSTAPTDLLYIRSAGTGTNMALRIANTTPTDILAVLDNQRVGIGTTLPTTPLTIIASNTAPASNLYLSGTAGARLIISQPDGGCSSCGVDAAGTTWACIDVTCP